MARRASGGPEGAPALPRSSSGRIQLVAGAILILLAFAGSAAVRVHGAVTIERAVADGRAQAAAGEVSTAAATAVEPAPAPAPAPDTFTVGELAAGTVPQEVQDRFWRSQLDAILAAPCPAAPAAGGTAVTLFLGADGTWTARLTDAVAEHAAACAD